MYICKQCGNYYQFNGSSITLAINKLSIQHSREYATPVYEEETTLGYEGIDFITCGECDSENVKDVEFKMLPKDLQDVVFETLKLGITPNVIMERLKKEVVNK